METQKPQTPLLLRLERHCILPKYLKFFADMNMTEAEFAAYTNNALESDIKDYIHESVPQVILMRLKNVKDEINSEGFVNIQSQPSATPPFTLLNSPPLPRYSHLTFLPIFTSHSSKYMHHNITEQMLDC
eukprot:TRINITY_DN9565_c0_g1_i2.p1 TRINITY_DN9565_c0_g1~~TRINITY_DN9565_c0_g1_i2.p1  ORF type:complete len:130 (-),score=26.76 TRINITY_DN9565_c0_g1_i2:8-397(-)